MKDGDPTDQSREASDSLDELLSQAVWSAPDPVAVGRLRVFWIGLTKRRRVSLWLPLAVAAMLLLGLGTLLSSLVKQSHEMAQWQDSDPAVQQNNGPANGGAGKSSRTDSEGGSYSSASSLPNTFERAIALTVQQRAGRAPRSDTEVDEVVASTVAKIAQDDQMDVATLAKQLAEQGTAAELQLAEFIRRTSGGDQMAAAKLLAHIATWRSLPILGELYRSAEMRPVVAPAIARLADPVSLFHVARAEDLPEVQQTLFAGLLEQGTAISVDLFLNLVNDPAWSSISLASLPHVKEAPVELLLSRLQDTRVSRRAAAAQTLGRLSRAEISHRLIAMADAGQFRREALLALVQSQEPTAVNFILRAQRDLSLMASVRALQARFNSPIAN